MAVGPARQATEAGELDSVESILLLLESFKIRVLITLSCQKSQKHFSFSSDHNFVYRLKHVLNWDFKIGFLS